MAKKNKQKVNDEPVQEVIYKPVVIQDFLERLKTPGITIKKLNPLTYIEHLLSTGHFGAVALILDADEVAVAHIENHTTYDIVRIYQRSAQDQILKLIDAWSKSGKQSKSVTIHTDYEKEEPA